MRPNVIYTIFLGVLAVRIRRSPRLCSAWKVLLILLLFILSVPADWGYTGVVIILVFDYYYGSWKHQAFAYCMVVMLDMGVLSLLIHPFFGLFYDHVFQIDWELYAYSVEYVGAFLPLLLPSPLPAALLLLPLKRRRPSSTLFWLKLAMPRLPL